jgi:hypothetical protein
MNIGTTVAATAAVPVMAFGIINAVSKPITSAAPAGAHRVVAYNWWRGIHEQRHYYGSVRPGVLGSSFGEPISSIRWAYWGRNTARGKGLLVHMNCQPCRVSVYLHEVRVTHGTRYFEKFRETFANHGGASNLHWSGRDWVG